MRKKKQGITKEEAEQMEREMRDGPSITSKTSMDHLRTTKFSMSKEPKT